jgi:putative multicomponent Na+:H+ antiporter subunit B
MSAVFTLASELDLLLPITALLPLTALLLVSQSNPYQTLVLRGILGSVATLLYALLGAPDVALTEALVGTLLSTTLYAIALRSSMVLRLEDRRRDPSAAVDPLLVGWASALHLRLRLQLPQPQQPGGAPTCHGWLADDLCLVIAQHPLHARLAADPACARWQQAGGQLVLAEQEAP